MLQLRLRLRGRQIKHDVLCAPHARPFFSDKRPILAQPPNEFTGLKLGKPATVAAGLAAVLKSGAFAFSYYGPVRGTPKLNRSHLVNGEMALLLPCYTCIAIDRWKSGQQFMSCDNTMGVVSMSKGVLEPLPGHQMLSEVAVVCGMATATLDGRSTVDWVGCTENYDLIRDYVERTIPGFEQFNEKVRHPGGFYLPNGPRKRVFTTANGKANFSATPYKKHVLEPGQLVMMTMRSHDQFNTTIYDYNDRYRGVYNERRIIFLNPEDMADRSIKEKDLVNITSHFEGQQRHAEKLIAIPYYIPKGNCAMYFPEGNVLVPA